jgi:mannose-6-phosphate isomerase-like protein (cupin superfamily)
MNARLLIAATALVAAPLGAQSTDPTGFASGAEVHAQVVALGASMKPGQGFAYKALLKDGAEVAGLEYWRKPGKPAVHPSQSEYAIVIEGRGTLVTGGHMLDAVVTRPGLTEGSRIEGGTTRRLGPGDVILVPKGVPHWFGIDGHLVLLGIKMPGEPVGE